MAAQSTTTRRRLSALRKLLRRLAVKLDRGKRLSDRDLAELSDFLDRDRIVREVATDDGGYTLRYRTVKGSLYAVPSEIAAAFAHMLVEGEPGRIRFWENPNGRWIIYHRSKNRSCRWCEGPGGGGNLLNVRRHRAGKRKQSSRAPGSSSADSMIETSAREHRSECPGFARSRARSRRLRLVRGHRADSITSQCVAKVSVTGLDRFDTSAPGSDECPRADTG